MKNKDIEILMKDGCTAREAEKLLKNGTIVCDAQSALEYIDDAFTLEDVKAGTVSDWNYVKYNGEDYYIMYVL